MLEKKKGIIASSVVLIFFLHLIGTVMAHPIIASLIFFFSVCLSNAALAVCGDTTSMLDVACKKCGDTWTLGNNDLYVPFHTHHMHFAYSDEKIDSFNENTWGLGYGRSRYDESGNWDGLYFMAFSDSHSKPEYIAGYGHQWIWGRAQSLHAGLGYTAFITARSDILNYIPFPAILPIASIGYNRVAINTTYVPGGSSNGNVLFFWSTIRF
jgi:palmitoyl transferase